MTTEIDRRIFVVGAPRSGTTLVQSLLASRNGWTSFTESHFFSRHYRRLPLTDSAILLRDPAPRAREFLEENGVASNAVDGRLRRVREAAGGWSRSLRSRSVARELVGLFDEIAGLRGCPNWVEKTPRHLRYVAFIESLYPGPARPHFVHVIRAGLEVVASLHTASQSWERPYDLDTCARRWNADLRLSLERIAAPSDHFVFYEDLTTDPQATLRRLFAALDLDWEPGIIERHAQGAAGRLVTPEERWKANVSRTPRPSATAEATLTEPQRHRVQRSLRHDLYAHIRESAS